MPLAFAIVFQKVGSLIPPQYVVFPKLGMLSSWVQPRTKLHMIEGEGQQASCLIAVEFPQVLLQIILPLKGIASGEGGGGIGTAPPPITTSSVEFCNISYYNYYRKYREHTHKFFSSMNYNIIPLPC